MNVGPGVPGGSPEMPRVAPSTVPTGERVVGGAQGESVVKAVSKDFTGKEIKPDELTQANTALAERTPPVTQDKEPAEALVDTLATVDAAFAAGEPAVEPAQPVQSADAVQGGGQVETGVVPYIGQPRTEQGAQEQRGSANAGLGEEHAREQGTSTGLNPKGDVFSEDQPGYVPPAVQIAGQTAEQYAQARYGSDYVLFNEGQKRQGLNALEETVQAMRAEGTAPTSWKDVEEEGLRRQQAAEAAASAGSRPTPRVLRPIPESREWSDAVRPQEPARSAAEQAAVLRANEVGDSASRLEPRDVTEARLLTTREASTRSVETEAATGVTPPGAEGPRVAGEAAGQEVPVGSLDNFTHNFFTRKIKLPIDELGMTEQDLQNFLTNMGVRYQVRDANGIPVLDNDNNPIFEYHSNLNRFISDMDKQPGTDADRDRLVQLNTWLTGQHAEAIRAEFQRKNSAKLAELEQKDPKDLTEKDREELAAILKQQQENQKQTIANKGAALLLVRGRIGRGFDRFVDAFTGKGIEEDKRDLRQYKKVVDAGEEEFRRYRLGAGTGTLRDGFVAFLRGEKPMSKEDQDAFATEADLKKSNLEAARNFMKIAGKELLKKRFIRGLLWLLLVIGPGIVTVLPAIATVKGIEMMKGGK